MSGVIGECGLFYHFLNNDDGLRYKTTELSTIDSGLLLAGVLSAMEYFDGTDGTERCIRELADQLYQRVEWDWLVNDEGHLSTGHRPEKGIITHYWSGYNEG